jgi:hypothetical protein
MAKEQEVERFLREFKEKMKVWDVIFRDDRMKNAKALLNMELCPIDRKKILENLKPNDYSEGPLEETLYGGSDMWVFGKEVKLNEVYIKITMGFPGKNVICISFHISEQKMNYPFKNK